MPGLRGASQPCQPRELSGLEQGEPRARDMEQYFPGPGAPSGPRARQHGWCQQTLLPGCGIRDCSAACLACPSAGHVHNPRAGAVLELHVNRKSPLLRPGAVPAGTPAAAAQPGPQHCRPEQPSHLNCFINGPRNPGSSLHLGNKYKIKQPQWLGEAKQSTLPKQGGCSY